MSRYICLNSSLVDITHKSAKIKAVKAPGVAASMSNDDLGDTGCLQYDTAYPEGDNP